MREKLVKSLLVSLLVFIILSSSKALASNMTFQMPYTPQQFITEIAVLRIFLTITD